MQMIGKNHPGIDPKRVTLANPADGFPQQIDLADQQVVLMPLEEVDREEPGSTGYEGASVVGNLRFPAFDV